MYTVVIVENKKKVACKWAVYVDWKPVACMDPNDSIPLQKQLVTTIGLASVTNAFDKFKKPGRIPAQKYSRTLSRYSVDAMAMSIEEGPQCFETEARWKSLDKGLSKKNKAYWSHDTNPHNPMARFARQIRTYMNKPENAGEYIKVGQEILAVGVVFEYRPKNGDDARNYCLLGRSLLGENVTGTFGNHEIGSIHTSKLPRGDWSEEIGEAFLTILLALVVWVVPRWRQVPQLLKVFQSSGRRKKIPYNGVAMIFLPLVALVSINIFWSSGWAVNATIENTAMMLDTSRPLSHPVVQQFVKAQMMNITMGTST
jgi:hypothetical protein